MKRAEEYLLTLPDAVVDAIMARLNPATLAVFSEHMKEAFDLYWLRRFQEAAEQYWARERELEVIRRKKDELAKCDEPGCPGTWSVGGETYPRPVTVIVDPATDEVIGKYCVEHAEAALRRRTEVTVEDGGIDLEGPKELADQYVRVARAAVSNRRRKPRPQRPGSRVAARHARGEGAGEGGGSA